MIEVRREGESIEKLIKKFTKAVRKDGVLQELQKRKAFTPKAQKRREKDKAAARRR